MQSLPHDVLFAQGLEKLAHLVKEQDLLIPGFYLQHDPNQDLTREMVANMALSLIQVVMTNDTEKLDRTLVAVKFETLRQILTLAFVASHKLADDVSSFDIIRSAQGEGIQIGGRGVHQTNREIRDAILYFIKAATVTGRDYHAHLDRLKFTIDRYFQE